MEMPYPDTIDVSEYTAVSSRHNLHNDIHFPNYFYNVYFVKKLNK